jgi:hypothetical protein
MSNLSDLEVSVPCPKCRKKTKQKLSRLKRNPTYVCSGCGETVKIDSGDLGDKLRAIDKRLDDFGKNSDSAASSASAASRGPLSQTSRIRFCVFIPHDRTRHSTV